MENNVIFFRRLGVLIILIMCSQCSSEKKIKDEAMNEYFGVYWGAFDPPTPAHLAIIEKSLKIFEGLIIVVNNGSYKNYSLLPHKRIEIIKSKLNQMKKNKILFIIQDDENPVTYSTIKKRMKKKICVIAGYDSYSNWSKKKDSPIKYDSIAVVPRGKEKPILFHENAFLMEISSKYRNISSTKLRALDVYRR
jgi:cytidyltransferase-like protein